MNQETIGYEKSVDEIIAEHKKPRETWTGRFDFFLTSLGYAVGLGAIWRFPYLCYKNGGGAFLIPYILALILLGIPLVFLEMAVGQFTSNGPMSSWVMSPIFKGIGFSVNTVNNYVNIYFTMVLAYSIIYLIVSINSELPWQNCHQSWKEKNCVDFSNWHSTNITDCSGSDFLKCNDGICFWANSTINETLANCDHNRGNLSQIGFWKKTYPSEIFWNDIILKKSPGIEYTG